MAHPSFTNTADPRHPRGPFPNGASNEPPAPAAPRRQPQADDDVHYTTSPFEAPRSNARPNEPGAPIDPTDKRGLVSRTAGSFVLILSALFGAAAVILTALMHVHISIPLFLLAGGLVYVGRRLLRGSAEQTTEQPVDSDPGRRREPDLGD